MPSSAALADLTRALELNPQDAAVYYDTACFYALQHDVEAACTWLEKAIALDEENRSLARTDSALRPLSC